MKLCALSVDLDEIPCYHAIHGLSEPQGESAHAVYARAVPRYRALLDELDVPCTFFVIGRDMKHEVARKAARTLVDAGHELANHTLNHRYEFSRMSGDAMRAEVRGGIEAVSSVQGFAPSGFRAPGYTVNDRVLDALAELGVFYDSSVFPCPLYWAGKTAHIGMVRARGRRSHSIVDTPAVLASPADPYVPARPYWRRAPSEGGLIELPIGVTRGARLPYIGTSVMAAGPRRVDLLTAQIAGRPLVNLELHGIDLLDEHDGLGALRPHQHDVKIPLGDKVATLTRVVVDLKARGYTFVTLREAAQAFANEVRG
jgi:peptidoglycan/xylan/chitin deacetylase (PgdA/CDA1 family)